MVCFIIFWRRRRRRRKVKIKKKKNSVLVGVFLPIQFHASLTNLAHINAKLSVGAQSTWVSGHQNSQPQIIHDIWGWEFWCSVTNVGWVSALSSAYIWEPRVTRLVNDRWNEPGGKPSSNKSPCWAVVGSCLDVGAGWQPDRHNQTSAFFCFLENPFVFLPLLWNIME